MTADLRFDRLRKDLHSLTALNATVASARIGEYLCADVDSNNDKKIDNPHADVDRELGMPEFIKSKFKLCH